jgi:hypothetical protein
MDGQGCRVMSRENSVKVFTVSVALLAPCFWHQHLVAGDLGSHVYNAWLVQLAKSKQAPGLWISTQWTNVLFDWMLEVFSSFLPIHLAGRVAVYIAVLTFFWSAFYFVSVARGRPPWTIAPLLAMVAFGWTFQVGFFNYYLALGLAFIGISFFWIERGWRRIVPIILSPIILLAHPFGFAWFVGAVAIIVITEVWPRRPYFGITAALGILGCAAWYLRHHYRAEFASHSAVFWNGLDQILLTRLYVLPAAGLAGLALFAVISIGRDVRGRGSEAGFPGKSLILLQLYILVEASILLLPDSIYTHQISAPLRAITTRATSISAVLLCGLIACATQRRWHYPAILGTSVIFFALLYHDTGTLSSVEQEIRLLVQMVAPGTRVLFTIHQPRNYRFSGGHILDAACIGRCFSYGNYEAATRAFRIRALAGNRIVMSRVEQIEAVESGDYIVQPEDLPAQLVYQCGPSWTDFCIRSLQAGENSGSDDFR